uniref:Uncharacterized protein n=1 Tax=Eutreptiella gymnastica TaxID=73025 RepID=A0A7S4LDL4_9EUGL
MDNTLNGPSSPGEGGQVADLAMKSTSFRGKGSFHRSSSLRSASATASVVPDLEFDEMLESDLETLAAKVKDWDAQAPTPEQALAVGHMVQALQGGLAAEMKKIRETHSKLKDHEKEYKTQITNLWQNNGKLDNEIHGLRGELDLAQRKLKTMENNMVKQGDKFQTEKEGLTIGTLDQKNMIMHLQTEVQKLTSQVESYESAQGNSRITELISEESQSRAALVMQYGHDLMRDVVHEMPTLVVHAGPPLVAAETRKTREVAESGSPGDGPQSPSSSSGDTFGSTVRAVALRREQAQKLSETLTALRRRIEGALDACATDQAPGSFEAEAAA